MLLQFSWKSNYPLKFLQTYGGIAREEMKKVRGMGFEPTNPLRDRILSPAHLATLLPPQGKNNNFNLFYKVYLFVNSSLLCQARHCLTEESILFYFLKNLAVKSFQRVIR